MNALHDRTTGASGQSTVEFALILPLLVLIVMGAFDFSVVAARAAQLSSAVQEGAAYARRAPTDAAGIRTHVKGEGSGLNLTDANITITCLSGLTTSAVSCSAAGFGDSVRVEATYSHQPLTGRMISITGSPVQVTRSATLEIY